MRWRDPSRDSENPRGTRQAGLVDTAQDPSKTLTGLVPSTLGQADRPRKLRGVGQEAGTESQRVREAGTVNQKDLGEGRDRAVARVEDREMQMGLARIEGSSAVGHQGEVPCQERQRPQHRGY